MEISGLTSQKRILPTKGTFTHVPTIYTMATFLHPQGDTCGFACIFLMYLFASQAQQDNNLLLIICFAKIWRTVSL